MFNYIKFNLFLKSSVIETDMAYGDTAGVEPKSSKQKEGNPDLSKLSPKEKEQYEKIQARIDELQKELDITKAGVGVVDNRKNILEQRTSENISFGELKEKGAYEVGETVIRLRGELGELSEQKDVLLRSIELTKVNKLSESELKQMQNITSKEFLSTPATERLRFITKGNVESKDVKEGGTKELDFTFTFDGKFNRELYIRTTAGQTLGENVRNVTSGGNEYTRKGLNGEFFSAEGKRLLIHEGTKIEITKFGTEDELKQIGELVNKSAEEFKNTPNEELALESLKKGYDPKFTIKLFGEKISSQTTQKKETIEDLLTDLARLQDDFIEDFPNEKAILDEGKPSEKFAGYVINSLKVGKEKEVSELYGYNIEKLKASRRTNNPALGGGPVNLEKINIDGVSKEEIDAILKKDKFTPGTKDAQVLFLAACQSAGLPQEWCTQESLHRILSRESNGVVGRLNYTIKGHTPETFKDAAVSTNSKNPIGVKSTASGLGQLLLSNVDKFYPDGRNGIGDPLNEAVGMLRYINDRYGSPDIAWSVYGKEGTYDHPNKGRQQKGFAEGY